MQIHEFFLRYANEPLSVRAKAINPEKYESLSLMDIHREVSAIEDKIRDDEIRRDALIRVAEWYWFEKQNV